VQSESDNGSGLQHEPESTQEPNREFQSDPPLKSNPPCEWPCQPDSQSVPALDFPASQGTAAGVGPKPHDTSISYHADAHVVKPASLSPAPPSHLPAPSFESASFSA
jgi:hypothetical protein